MENTLNMQPNIGVVVIGRNEGQRLLRCLQSLAGKNHVLVYVDSGSSDGSIQAATRLGANTVALDMTTPFTAARARNAGFQHLMQISPNLKFVQFVDGDCELSKEWLEAARLALLQDDKRAVVVGHLRELNPHLSIYNQLCALEWKSPPGDLTNFGALGGLSMMRTEVFRALDGFNAQVIAGEDSEFGVRLSLAGYKVTKIDHSMATHDANITSFGQWWKRAVRGGHAIGQRAYLNGNSAAQDCVKERKSTLFWGVFLPIAALLLLIPTYGLSLIVLLIAYAVLGLKVFTFRRKQNDTQREAFIYATFIILSKLANGLGLIKFYINKLKQRYEIIEYKQN
jgi:glycosyltransferase involved in cell wall biosynthesis